MHRVVIFPRSSSKQPLDLTHLKFENRLKTARRAHCGKSMISSNWSQLFSEIKNLLLDLLRNFVKNQKCIPLSSPNVILLTKYISYIVFMTQCQTQCQSAMANCNAKRSNHVRRNAKPQCDPTGNATQFEMPMADRRATICNDPMQRHLKCQRHTKCTKYSNCTCCDHCSTGLLTTSKNTSSWQASLKNVCVALLQ